MLILHHYDMSPFSEKLRLMCGYAGLEWQSVISPESPPRPIVDPLTGGYRRIPVAQVGADIFCDTRLISAELACRANRPELDPAFDTADNQALALKGEKDMFFPAVLSIPASRILRKLFTSLPILQALRFLRDRAGMAKAAAHKPPSPKEAVGMFREFLAELEQRLASGSPYLGGEGPTHVDFATVHLLWFQLVVGGLPMPGGLPQVEQWYARMMALGHGTSNPATGADAFAAARENDPHPIPAGMTDDAQIGQQVSIRPDDYALDVTSGILVGADATRWIVARDADGLGTLHVHFPRRGFCLE